MSIVGFGPIADLKCSSLWCFGRELIDRNCNFNAPNVSVDHRLSVDIGGNVDMFATTVDFRNATLDFTGASVTGLVAEITGNLSADFFFINNTLFAENIDAGNIVANCISTDKITAGTITANITGNFCGEIVTVDTLKPKTGSGIVVMGANIVGDVVGDLYGTSYGTHCGPVTTSLIEEKITGGGVTVDANLFADQLCSDRLLVSNIVSKISGESVTFDGNVLVLGELVVSNIVIESGLSIGNTFGVESLQVNVITPLSGTIVAVSSPVVTVSNVLNVCGNLHVNNIFEKTDGSGVFIGNTLTIANVVITDNATLPTLDSLTVTNDVTADSLIVSNVVCTPNIFVNTLSSKTTNGNIVVESYLCVANVFVNTINAKSTSNITVSASYLIGNVLSFNELTLGGNAIVAENLLLSSSDSALIINGSKVVGVQQSDISNVLPATVVSVTTSNVVGTGDDANINANFDALESNLNALIVDVSDIRDITDLILQTLRVHGLIG